MAKKAYIGVDGKARKVKKGYIGVENFVPRALPSGYTQLSHIEATGAQYFDTGFAPNQDTRVVCKAQYTDISGSFCLFGARYSVNERRYDFLVTGSRFYSEYNANSGSYPTLSATTDVLEIDKNKNVTTVNGVTHSSHNYGAFQAPCNMLLFAENTNNSPHLQAKAKVWDYMVYDNGTLIRDYVPCKNTSGVVGLYDMVNGTFGGSATSTPFVAGDTYESVARKIKKAYIGIGGVARPCWSGGELAYYGTITALSAERYNLAATSVGDYALFGGGQQSQKSNVVDAYNTSLTRKTAATLSTAVSHLAAATIGNYALFAGGMVAGNGKKNTVNAYDTALTRSLKYLGTARYSLAAATVGNYAVFGGGFATKVTNVVDAFDASLTQKTITSLSVARYELSATTVGNYAIFGGGWDGSNYYATVDAYDSSLTRSIPTAMGASRINLAATTVGNYALFAGGSSGVSSTAIESIVDAYNESLTRTTATELSLSRRNLMATTVGECAVFGGGHRNGGVFVATVDVYDASLTRTVSTEFSVVKHSGAATTVGNYALFGGGVTSGGGETNVVDAYVCA